MQAEHQQVITDVLADNTPDSAWGAELWESIPHFTSAGSGTDDGFGGGALPSFASCLHGREQGESLTEAATQGQGRKPAVDARFSSKEGFP